eukprot:TRINITY_DN4555_c2_g1_i4.p2 TRINITY_DN4555_c2_g1~~TRINITY_DN4555_c2_g1_i4.p2  ORF type:complete len:141 (+),score=18.77 TRINITY_DN4555_c2_g1_i4:63-485(+)
MGSGWCWVAGAVFASLLCGVGGQEAAIDVNVPFPNELLGEHIALIAVPLAVTGAAICCAVVIACARTLKLTVVLVLGVWLALLSVGIVSWYVTYNTSPWRHHQQDVRTSRPTHRRTAVRRVGSQPCPESTAGARQLHFRP